MSAWQFIHSAELVAESVDNRSYNPIPPLALPDSLNFSQVVARAQSVTAKPTWRVGCSLILSVPLELGEQIQNVQGHQFSVLLGRWQVLAVPQWLTDYRIAIEVPYWIQDLTIELYGADQPAPSSVGDGASYSRQFTAADLEDGVLVLRHNLNAYPTSVTVWNADLESIFPYGVRATGLNTVEIDLDGAEIVGTWLASLEV